MTVDKHAVQKLRRGQEILAATPAIDVQILVGAAWPANYRADRHVRYLPRAEIKGAERAPLNRQLTATKITAKRTSWQPVLGATAIVFGVASIIIHAYAFQALPLRANLGTAVTD